MGAKANVLVGDAVVTVTTISGHPVGPMFGRFGGTGWTASCEHKTNRCGSQCLEESAAGNGGLPIHGSSRSSLRGSCFCYEYP